MPTFFDEFRDFLAPHYELIRELGRGGMGTVYLAREKALPRHVAIKVIPPEKATLVALRRFRNEASYLAQLEHPNIVTIHAVAPEGSRYFYYVMQFIDGETLEQHLKGGPRLPGAEAAKIGREVLAALDLVHSRHIVHRDVKPSNIFLQNDRAILADFGIAKSLDGHSSLTEPDRAPRTPHYAPPELEHGKAVPQSDFYSLAMVLFEAVTGQPWEKVADPGEADWSAVPDALRPALCRALAWQPNDRWSDARVFDRALSGRQVPRTVDVGRLVRSKPFFVGVGIAAAAIVTALLWRPVDLRVLRPVVEGGAPGLGDSVARHVVARLAGFPDFSVAGPTGLWRARAKVSGAASVTGQSLTIRLDLSSGPPVSLAGALADWKGLADQLADSVAVRLYQGGLLDAQLPLRVMPQTPAGMQAFFLAERAFARAWWDSAYTLYDRAAQQDPTCVLCRWRHAEVGRFLSQPEDTADERAYRARVGDFPAQYQALIRAELVPLRARLDSLALLSQRWPKFIFGRYRYADELIHRGPLIGRARREASVYFEQTLDVHRDFVPAWEHLLWLWIAEGDAREAKPDLDSLTVLAPRATTPVRDLLDAAFAWRFLPPQQAAGLTLAVIPAARARQEPLDAGARYLNAFDAQVGAVWLGALLDSANDHRESAMLAQLFGAIAQGRPQRARALESRVVAQFGDPAVELFGLELAAAQMMFDPDSTTPPAWMSLAARLREFAAQSGMELRPRAEWMAALLAQHVGRQAGSVSRGTPPPLVALLDADRAAGAGDYDAALRRSDALIEVESAGVGDPFFRTILHFLRADWEWHRGKVWSADRELTWYENTDVIEYPTGAPQPSEVDWAFGVLARWHRLGLTTVPDDRCRLSADVARLWADGEPAYKARADSARRAVTALRCSALAS